MHLEHVTCSLYLPYSFLRPREQRAITARCRTAVDLATRTILMIWHIDNHPTNQNVDATLQTVQAYTVCLCLFYTFKQNIVTDSIGSLLI